MNELQERAIEYPSDKVVRVRIAGTGERLPATKNLHKDNPKTKNVTFLCQLLRSEVPGMQHKRIFS